MRAMMPARVRNGATKARRMTEALLSKVLLKKSSSLSLRANLFASFLFFSQFFCGFFAF